MFRGDFTSNTKKLTQKKKKKKKNNHHHHHNNFNGKIGPLFMVSTGSEPDMERLKPLHNFDLPWLKWGNQKLLRCMKVDSNDDASVVDRNQPPETYAGGGGCGGAKRKNLEFHKRFRSSYNDYDRTKKSFCKFSSSEKVPARIGIAGVDRQSSESSGGGGGVIGAKRRNSKFTERFRSSYDDDRMMESYRKFSASEKLPALNGNRIGMSGVDRNQSSESSGVGGDVFGAKRRHSEFEKRFRSSYNDDDRTMEIFNKFSASEKLPARNGTTGEGEIEATREKLMFDFQNEVVKMKDAILRDRLVDPPPPPPPPPSFNPPAERPWNLRTRRAACKAPRSPTNGVNSSGEVLKPNSSPAVNECKIPNLRPSHGGVNATTSGEKTERPKFSVSLSRREVEEDFMAITGRKLPRKPKKRPRAVQKQLDTLFPGLWLSEITADMYKVPHEP